METARNKPCPCGSGKKYKRCCGPKGSSRATKSITINFDALSFYKNYNFKEILLWLQVIICHPKNQLFLHRIEFCITQLFAIHPKSFKGEHVTRSVMKELFTGINSGYEQLFRNLEDFEGYPQQKKIPLFFDNKRYYFFYGGLERPYEMYTRFIERYFSGVFDSFPEFNTLFTLFRRSLTFQTRYLSLFEEYPETTEEEVNKVFIPDTCYFEKYSRLFQYNDSFDFPENLIIEAGAFVNKKVQIILNETVKGTILSQKFFVKVEDGLLWLYPPSHFKQFLDLARAIVWRKSQGKDLLYHQLKRQVQKAADQVFTIYTSILKLSGESQIILDIDAAYYVDRNKLLLFKAVEPSPTMDLSIVLEQAANAGLKQVQKLKNENLLTVTTPTGDYTLPLNGAEIYLFVVCDSLTFNTYAGIKEPVEDYNSLYCFGLLDLLALFSELKDGQSVIKYLKADRDLHGNIKEYMGEYIERFSFYIQNGFSFLRTANSFTVILYEPHFWHSYIHDKLYERYQDEKTYLEIHRKVKGHYNIIDKVKDTVYRLTESATTSGAYLISSERFNLWVVMPEQAQFLDGLDFQMAYDILGELYKDYLHKQADKFVSFLNQVGLPAIRYCIILIPAVRLKLSHWEFLLPLYKQSEDGIFVLSRFYNSPREIVSYIVYEAEQITSAFDKLQNDGERLCLQRYIESLLIMAGQSQHFDGTQASAFVDTILPIGTKRYGAAFIDVGNAKLDQYAPHTKFNEADFGTVSRLISKYLIEQEVQPGFYKNQEASVLSSNLYKYLQTYIEGQLKLFTPQLVDFLYQQLELAEGYKYKNRVGLGLKGDSSLDYDLYEQYGEQERSASILTISMRHLLHTSIKVAPEGHQIPSRESTTFLLALAKVSFDVAMLYDNLNFGLSSDFIKVSDESTFTIENENQIFDSAAFHNKQTSLEVDYWKSRTNNKTTATKLDTDELAFKEFQSTINNAFVEELGFSYEDLMFVLYTLSTSPFSKGNFFPVISCSLDDLTKSIRFLDTQSMNKDYIAGIIRYLTIEIGCYPADYYFFQSQLLKNKNRITVCPIIKQSDGSLVYAPQCSKNAFHVWHNTVKGIFPFELPGGSLILKELQKVHQRADEILEEQVYKEVQSLLTPQRVISRLKNFKRLSKTLPESPSCGEIDILAISPEKKMVFVMEIKNASRRPSYYHVHNSIRQFFTSSSAYYKKLLHKKSFIEQHLQETLLYFKITDINGWSVRELFVTSDVQFAAFFEEQSVTFILLDELEEYISSVSL